MAISVGGVSAAEKPNVVVILIDDQRIGDLVAKLDELGLRDNTIIVFQSDNGHST